MDDERQGPPDLHARRPLSSFQGYGAVMGCVVLRGKRPHLRTILCIDEDGPLVVPHPDCPNAACHTPHPHGYIAHSSWADRMMTAGWTQPEPCPGCGTWSVWVPPDQSRAPGSASSSATSDAV